MKTIQRHVLKFEKNNEIELPEGAKILSIQAQFDDPTLWAWVDTEKPLVKRKIVMYGTGHNVFKDQNLTPDLTFLATVQFESGNYVYHFFEKVESNGV